jgi:hypothetical protein
MHLGAVMYYIQYNGATVGARVHLVARATELCSRAPNLCVDSVVLALCHPAGA